MVPSNARAPHRIRRGAGLLVVAALTVPLTACGGSSSKHAAPTTGEPTVTEAVTTVFQQFFDGNTPAAQKISLLENGAQFADAINAQAGSPMAKSTTATVQNVASSGTDHVDVTYTILLAGTAALSGQRGGAVRAAGGWKVTAATFCALLTLEGNPPAACAGVPPIG
ncbi:hypothetical protein [Nocardia stercoris]|uniref:Low molecular weight antigen MTB12-like C-terminal domain-containing protein n=1 Tax=Nocardia stercoris TaxID=2483361 RepID=A0A3M2LJV4_9NOCA|nr:hypothetical protein [Nocardia stercoris]RMI35048.1 hypothetical protein EBN03_01585 [Nocardia stercoris]